MKKLKSFIKDPQTIIGMVILFVIIALAILAPVICPGKPLFSVGKPMSAPSSQHYFGTDHMGRDVWAMIVWGSRISVIFAFGAAALSLIIGVVMGALSGYIGGVFDDVMCRFFELFYIIPRTFLIILMVAIFGSSIGLMVLIVGITIWPSNAKIMRAQVLMLKTRGYVQAAEVAGGRKLNILFKHVVPNGIGPVLSNSTLQMAQAVLTEASLSFLGLGDPNKASWGLILNAGQKHISSAPWLVIVPGVALALMLLAFNLIGTALHKALNVKQQILE
jgi:peptide/nickel transport system permease protein